ncbi:hypothetical protein A3A67_01850 [Candidatus Peribacteria bacterium RIFCSPLOWO2_01_FULL_51_18]|nr:MAG: hypothetical protein A3C52_05270 [Candidatus Peribacteria bacterium RIFCSPHIGHO2_02_FULL_51_15]OGJ66322.1 MAG: hypothetical protein A3A67_01850 [Candidatus Peribacteria bacterium RIFCSPLOWO2_01_FULL_51_18]OGJ68525.1 MAG: hypothetical protein A3J34_05085 [Candidatus Peribacteria bacterium RIFCSPLOWO2_02_FULL_51_10]
MPPLRVFFADDSAHEREQVTSVFRDFLPEAEVVTAATIEEAIIRVRALISQGLDAAILDLEFCETASSSSIYAFILSADPTFAQARVAVRTNASEEVARTEYDEHGVPFPPKFLNKGVLFDMLKWVKELQS